MGFFDDKITMFGSLEDEAVEVATELIAWLENERGAEEWIKEILAEKYPRVLERLYGADAAHAVKVNMIVNAKAIAQQPKYKIVLGNQSQCGNGGSGR